MLGNLDQLQMDYLLRSQVVGRIGCYAFGKTYVVPVTYVYEGEYLYGHTKIGMKITMLRANPSVCFEVDAIQNMANWQSVIVQGLFEELTGEESQQALRLLVNRIAPLVVSETNVPSHGMHSQPMDTGSHPDLIVYRIRILEKTGRYEKRNYSV